MKTRVDNVVVILGVVTIGAGGAVIQMAVGGPGSSRGDGIPTLPPPW